jgi:chloramphenicol 3-O-phosphotransferase
VLFICVPNGGKSQMAAGLRQVLDHSSIRLTMDTYAHVLDRQLSGAADAMDHALGARAASQLVSAAEPP